MPVDFGGVERWRGGGVRNRSSRESLPPATARAAGSVSILPEDLGHSCPWKEGLQSCPGSWAQRFLFSLSSQAEPREAVPHFSTRWQQPACGCPCQAASASTGCSEEDPREGTGRRLAARVRMTGPGDLLIQSPLDTGGCKYTAVLPQAPATRCHPSPRQGDRHPV